MPQLRTTMSAEKSSNQTVAPEPATYAFQEVVLGKVKGWAAYPAWVIDPNTAPQAIRRDKPRYETAPTYLVQFFPVGDYAWLTPKEISKLEKHDIEAYINKPRKTTPTNKELLAGYRAALNPTEWEMTLGVEVADVEENDDEEHSSQGNKRKKSATLLPGEEEPTGSISQKAGQPPTKKMRLRGNDDEITDSNVRRSRELARDVFLPRTFSINKGTPKNSAHGDREKAQNGSNERSSNKTPEEPTRNGTGNQSVAFDMYVEQNEDLRTVIEEGPTVSNIRRCIEDTTSALRYGRLSYEEGLARYDQLAAMLGQIDRNAK
ncbi:hypothetical protein PM082_000551 [Marasmius tenuissimus]|nr:hypothetical protein PM082_000551 [Marasmius tenuissimus]